MTTSPISTPRATLRLQLQDHSGSGPVDGAWWPQSRDLQTEAADLVDHFPVLSGRIDRLLFSRPDWDAGPVGSPVVRKISSGRGAVKVGSFPSDDTHLMILKLSSGQRLRLLVVPDDTSPTYARDVMSRAASDDNQSAAADLLGSPRVGVKDQDTEVWDGGVWDDDGGGTAPIRDR